MLFTEEIHESRMTLKQAATEDGCSKDLENIAKDETQYLVMSIGSSLGVEIDLYPSIKNDCYIYNC